MAQLIKLLLEDNYVDEFMKIQNLFDEEDYESLFEKYKDQLGLEDIYEDAEEFIDGIDEEEIGIETLLLWFANSKGMVLWLDWKDEGGQLLEDVNQLLIDKFNFDLDINSLADESEDCAADFEEDDTLIGRFKFINKILKNNGFKLINIDNDSDEYFLTVIKAGIELSSINDDIDFIEISDVDDIEE